LKCDSAAPILQVFAAAQELFHYIKLTGSGVAVEQQLAANSSDNWSTCGSALTSGLVDGLADWRQQILDDAPLSGLDLGLDGKTRTDRLLPVTKLQIVPFQPDAGVTGLR
jgi:hypothetical protein